VGETIELAPRDPDPASTYRWRIKSAPVASQVDLGADPVEPFTPDAAGTYTIELSAPDGLHELTVRVFPGEYAPQGAGAGGSGVSGQSGQSGVSGRSGVSGMSGYGGASGSGSGAFGAERGRGEGGRPRVQLRGRIEDDEVVVEADPQPNPNDDTPPEELDVEFLVDDRSNVDRSQIEVDDRVWRAPLSAIGEWVRVHAVAIGPSYSVPDAVEIRRTDGDLEVEPDGGAVDTDGGAVDSDGDVAPDGGRAETERDADDGDGGATDPHGDALSTDGGVEAARVVETGSDVRVDRPYDPPDWATRVTLYEIYVRGFTDDEDVDTTFEALEDRLEYLDDLGVDCLWLTPVLQNDHAPHGYNITDFFSIADDLGDREDYESFVEAAHDRDMKVLFDLVLNHSARDHPYFKDASENPDSEYHDWYEWRENGEPGTYFDWEYIANFNFENLEVRRHLLDAVDQWFELADGFRCDMAWAVPRSFWQEIRDRVKSRDPEFLLLDETIPYIADFHEGMFDMHFDTTLYFTLRQVGRGDADADAILDAIEQRRAVGFPDHAAFMLYQENHDETRYVVDCGDEAAFASAGALFTLPGVPMLYAGQELGQRGNRDPLAWEHAREEIREHYEHLIAAREATPALGYHGGFRRVDYEADSDQVTAFARDHEDGDYVVVLNFGAAPETVRLGPDVEPVNAVSGRDVATEDGLEVESVLVLPAA
jgi:glycosidase